MLLSNNVLRLRDYLLGATLSFSVLISKRYCLGCHLDETIIKYGHIVVLELEHTLLHAATLCDRVLFETVG